ncbi:MAG: phospholipase D-like domain-containing protein [Saprospiraceae bacterium]
MTEAYFQNLPEALCRHLSAATNRVQAAVCWFSHRAIFEVLLKKLRTGTRVELLLEYDSQNIHQDGLDFQKFIKLGGELYAYRDAALMHHKFALLDERHLLTGSFNWTYNSNAENLLVTADPAIVAAFRQEFSRLKGLSVQVQKIRPAEVKVFAAFPLFQNTYFQLNDLRRRISGGAGVWWTRAGRTPESWAPHFREHRLPLDPTGLLRPYWTAYRLWDTGLFDEMWPVLETAAKHAAARAVRALARRARTGDVLLAVCGKRQLVGLGIVQSDLRCDWAGGEAASYREVQWLRTFPDAPMDLEKNVGTGAAGRFRGSALRVVQGVFEGG